MKNRPPPTMSGALADHMRAVLSVALALTLIAGSSSLSALTRAEPLTWLKTANYSALDRYLTDLQRGYEAGEVPEHKLYEGFRALYEPGVDNALSFDRWVQAYPKSYVARTARGAYYYRMAWFIRGEKFILETPPEHVLGMKIYLTKASPDLLVSLKMTAKPYMSTLYLLNVAQLVGSRAEKRYWLDVGNAIDPSNTLLRSRYMICLLPRWGGSIPMMRNFRVETQQQQVSPALLTKFDIAIHTETAYSFAHKGDVNAAFNQWEQVLKLSATDDAPPSDEALIGYARSAWRLQRRAEADSALKQLAARNVDDGSILSRMGSIYVQEGRMAEAWTVLQKAASLGDPSAQFSVGKTTYLGCVDINLVANRDAGLIWLRLSAKQGFAAAKDFLLEHDR